MAARQFPVFKGYFGTAVRYIPVTGTEVLLTGLWNPKPEESRVTDDHELSTAMGLLQVAVSDLTGITPEDGRDRVEMDGVVYLVTQARPGANGATWEFELESVERQSMNGRGRRP
jgi:hypothetical protein